MARPRALLLLAAALLPPAAAAGCSLASLPSGSLASVSAACGSAVASGTLACSTCLPELVRAFNAAGVQSSAEVLACVASLAPALQTAGAAPETVALLTACTALAGTANGIQLLPCPLNLTQAAAAPLQSTCTSPGEACRSCMGATKTALVDAGLDPQLQSSLILNRTQYNAVQSCTRSFMPLLLSSGVPAATLLALRNCPVPPTQYVLSSSLTLGGVRAADVAMTAIALSVTTILGAVSGQALVTGAVDSGSRRLLLAPSCTISLSVDADTAAQQTRFRAALAAAVADGSLLRSLVASGVPATSVSAGATTAAAATTIVGHGGATTLATGAPVSAPGSTPAADTVDKRVVAGAVAGSVAGTVPLVAHAAFIVLRRGRTGRASNTGPLLADAATGSARWGTNGSASSSRSGAPTPSSSKSDATPSLVTATDTDDSERGWTAVVSTADEVVLGEALGSGGFATVYAAEWRGSTVAVKLFDPATLEITPTESSASASASTGQLSQPWPTVPSMAGRDDSSAREVSRERTFMQEVSLLSKVRHPNVLAVYAMVHSPRMLIMELAPGGSLRTLLARSTLAQLPWAARVGVLTGVAAGVEFLHAQGIIHCDLKSENVVMNGLVPKVADFSISSRKGATGAQTSAGTPAFMAPEVARGEVVQHWEAVDAYGFGCIVHDAAHANTGGSRMSLNESGTWNGIQVLVRRELAGYERAVAPLVPAPLAALATACLSVDPAARPSLAAARMQLAGMQQQSRAW